MKGQYVTHLLIRKFQWNFLLSGHEIAYFSSSSILPQCISTKIQLTYFKFHWSWWKFGHVTVT